MTLISPKAKAFIESLNGSGYITTGAEGKHTRIGTLTHENGLKLDLQPYNPTNVEYAKMCINLLNHPKTAYINLESFTKEDIQEVKNYIYKSPILKEKCESKAKFNPGNCDGKVLTSIYTGYSKHLDIGIIP